MLYRGEVVSTFDECLAAELHAHEMEDNKWYSDVIWGDAVNKGVVLENIGYTGVDNGLISYRRDKITNAQFLDIFTNSTYVIDKEEKRFFFTPVTGNSNQFKYNYSLEKDESGEYFALKGGFFQGFFKLDGHDYQTLPHKIENDWNFEFVLRKKNYEVEHRTLNNIHPENNGIFFYIGTRAENKFFHYYKKHKLTEELYSYDCFDEDYFAEFKPSKINVTQHDYLVNENGDSDTAYNSNCNCTCNAYFDKDDIFNRDFYFSQGGEIILPDSFDDKTLSSVRDLPSMDSFNRQDYRDFSLCGGGCGDSCGCGNYTEYMPNVDGECIVDDYFSDSYVMNDAIGAFEENYFEREISLDGLQLFTSNGHDVSKKGYYSILTDNKFLTFDRTKLGFTTDTFDNESPYVSFEGRNDWGNHNYFTLMNHTTTGYTTKDIGIYNEETSKEFDIYRDLKENAFALKINEDGSIGYRYGVTNCENESKYDVIEEFSKDGIVKNDEWCTINVRIFLLNSENTVCDIKQGKRKMKIYVYVDGKLVLVSKELPEFNFRRLDELSEKQESVPYNISLGGGSQGLIDMITLHYYDKPEYELPIERDFCGTFLGDIKTFRFYDCFRAYNSINSKVFTV